MSPCIHPISSRLSTAVPPRRDSNLGQIEMITRINAYIMSYAVIGYLENLDFIVVLHETLPSMTSGYIWRYNHAALSYSNTHSHLVICTTSMYISMLAPI